MRVYRFHKDSLGWFASYLSDRKQCVKINKTMSDQQIIIQGVPQGSILGPLFFLLSVTDLPLQDSLGLTLFAEDAAGSAHGIDLKSVQYELQIISDIVNSWCCANNMAIGIDKTKCMLMGSKQKPRTIVNSEKCLNLEVLGYKIEQVTSQKLLGIQIDNSLTSNEQIAKIKKTVLFKLSLLRKIKKSSYYKPPALLFSTTTLTLITITAALSGVKLAKII